MKPEAIVTRQRYNTLTAYRGTNFEWSTSVLDDIVEGGIKRKHPFFTLFGEEGTVVAPREFTHEEYVSGNWTLRDLERAHPDYAFNYPARTVTERVTGKCVQLKKFLKARDWHEDSIFDVLSQLEQQRPLFISAHPWFLIGGSVAAGGGNVECSCHHPGSSTKDYKSGAISYGIDRQTIMFGLWDTDDNGLLGRQLVYVDREAPGIIAGRKYGKITETDSSHLRKVLYKLLKPEVSLGDWKKTKDYKLDRNGYNGYLDKDHFEGYRPQKDNTIDITLSSPRCPCCGDTHSNGELMCSACGDDDRYDAYCESCNCGLTDDECFNTDDGPYCESCFDDRYFNCHGCGENYDLDEKCDTTNGPYCQSCAERKGYTQCERCDDWVRDTHTLVDGGTVCESCLPSDFVQCVECYEWDRDKYMETSVEGARYCSSCVGDLDTCDDCGGVTCNGLFNTTDGLEVCSKCVKTKYIHTCPACDCVSETEGACCHECATDNLFLLAA